MHIKEINFRKLVFEQTQYSLTKEAAEILHTVNFNTKMEN
jgi:hypothetical protein